MMFFINASALGFDCGAHCLHQLRNRRRSAKTFVLVMVVDYCDVLELFFVPFFPVSFDVLDGCVRKDGKPC